MGRMVLPSVKARTETSGPVKNSSMTTLEPLSPKILSAIISRRAFLASSRVSAMMTPLPSAKPVGLDDLGQGRCFGVGEGFG